MIALTVALGQVQREQRVWVRRNFPDREPWESLVGAFEELGEAYGVMGAHDRREYEDAIADHVMYLVDVCSALGLDAPELLKLGRAFELTGRPWIQHLGRLAHHFLKKHQGIRGSAAEHDRAMSVSIGAIFATLEREFLVAGRSLGDVVWNTWCEVRERDWRKYPQTGKPVAP